MSAFAKTWGITGYAIATPCGNILPNTLRPSAVDSWIAAFKEMSVRHHSYLRDRETMLAEGFSQVKLRCRVEGEQE